MKEMERYTREQFEQDRKARQEREAAQEQARRERVEKDTARQAWVNDGGREQDFERQWASMRDEARRRRVAEADRQARHEMRRSAGSRI